jgi:hypothetical protein
LYHEPRHPVKHYARAVAKSIGIKKETIDLECGDKSPLFTISNAATSRRTPKELSRRSRYFKPFQPTLQQP